MRCFICGTLILNETHCPKCGKLIHDFNNHGANIGSQNGEAGIIEYIFREIGDLNKTVLEIGFGKECNSVNLLSNHGWAGWLIDEDPAVVKHGTERWPKAHCIEAHMTKKNINKVIKEHKIPRKVDMISIDVDGIDYYLWEALKVEARLVVIEYNASFGPKASCTVEYSPDFDRMTLYPGYHGASLAALKKLGEKKGYALVGCEGSGVNAFFVKKKYLTGDLRELSVKEAYYNHRNRPKWSFEMVAMDDRGLKFVEV